MTINLQKGQTISLERTNGTSLNNICVGINWGAIDKSEFFGLKKSKVAVDLDASCALYDDSKNLLEIVYFGNLLSKDKSIRHSGDDLTGDFEGDDGLDNEIITLDFTLLDPSTTYVAFVLNSFRGHDFGSIPFASIRIYEGTPKDVREVFASYDIANGSDFAGHISMVLGVFHKLNGKWEFNAIGEPTKDKKLQETVDTVTRNHL